MGLAKVREGKMILKNSIVQETSYELETRILDAFRRPELKNEWLEN